MADSTQEIRVFVAHSDGEAFAEIDEALVDNRALRIIGRSTEAAQATQLMAQLKPDVLVIDGDDPKLEPMGVLEDIFVKDLPIGGIILWEVQDNDRIRQAMRAGAEDFLIKPVEAEALVVSVNNAFNIVREKFPEGWTKPEPAAAPTTGEVVEAGGKVIGVCSGKAGTGKTTVATNLAVALAKVQKLTTTLIDLDHCEAAVLLNLRPARSLADLGQLGGDLDFEMVKSCLSHHQAGVGLVPGTTQPGVDDLESVNSALLGKVLNLLRANEHYVIVIFPLLHGDEHFGLLPLCDEVLCVATARNLLDLKSTKMFLDAISEKFVTEEKLRVVLNRYSKDEFVSLEDVEKTLHRKVYITLPEEEKLVTDSINLGVPFVLKDSKHPMSEGVIHLSGIVSGREVPGSDKDREKHGWWIFGKKH
ncbi:MAG: P-loop NTPase [Armatimonadetes bacterium]|nr:P-loop NTPase [Armatimonadota bacterium]